MTDLILDISRLISRVRHVTPSGVDRVEMAYARGLLAHYDEALSFAAVHPTGVYGRLQRPAALAYLDELERRWAEDHESVRQRSFISVLPWLRALRPTRRGIGAGGVYVQVSPHHLTRTEQVRRILSRERARMLALVHDLIPIEFPEYARPGGAALHARRMTTLARHAEAVIVNSAATGASFARWTEQQGKAVPPIHVALLGTEPVAQAPAHTFADARPYFLCLGTIEPRKNHLLLLHLWRQMAETLPAEQIPRLVVVGRRGWENEQILDLLERCDALKPHVTEINGCPDAELAALLRGARALLMPSFAEGYGMPIAEALSVGTPVLASDIAAHREVGGHVPDYRDPLDGPGWRAAILDHAERGDLHRAQMQRLPDWHAPDWSAHMKVARRAIESLRS
ncbi:glycosyltransferase family 4 protein [Novosphingobium profundi]|uniref:glycosyltransferase family 4 protein n=1 Tax=Novosphingobium profundi TaxID=1774954 RepID=UPI001CFC8E89|nr:glycosyltransferase family 1 protein [Novosphingobium profundi]